MKEPVTVAFACLKGGVGKTTTAVHCADAWTRKLGENTVQVLDRDVQKNAEFFTRAMPQVLAENAESARVRIIDTPPTLGQALIASLHEARLVVVPVNAFGAVQGLAALEATLQNVRGHNPLLRTCYVLTMQHPTASSSRLIASAMHARYGSQLLNATIRRADAFESAWAAGQTVFDFAPRSSAAGQMQAVCDELFERLKL